MDIDSGFLNSLFWFIAGAFSFKMLSALVFGATQTLLMERVIGQALVLLQFSSKAHESILNLKYSWMKGSGKLEERLPQVREADRITLEIWKAASINNIINCCPSKVRHVIKFENWQTAMNYLAKISGERR